MLVSPRREDDLQIPELLTSFSVRRLLQVIMVSCLLLYLLLHTPSSASHGGKTKSGLKAHFVSRPKRPVERADPVPAPAPVPAAPAAVSPPGAEATPDKVANSTAAPVPAPTPKTEAPPEEAPEPEPATKKKKGSFSKVLDTLRQHANASATTVAAAAAPPAAPTPAAATAGESLAAEDASSSSSTPSEARVDIRSSGEVPAAAPSPTYREPQYVDANHLHDDDDDAHQHNLHNDDDNESERNEHTALPTTTTSLDVDIEPHAAPAELSHSKAYDDVEETTDAEHDEDDDAFE